MFTQGIQKAQASHRKTSVQQLLSLLILSLLALTIFAGKAHAQIVGEVDVNVPFQFHVGNAKFPAGMYHIRMLDDSTGVMEISSADDSMSALFQVRDTEAKSAPGKTELIFSKYGNRYILAKLFDEGNPSGSRVIDSGYEKRIGQAGAPAEQHVPAHHRN
jgi:hypothetical protein